MFDPPDRQGPGLPDDWFVEDEGFPWMSWDSVDETEGDDVETRRRDGAKAIFEAFRDRAIAAELPIQIDDLDGDFPYLTVGFRNGGQRRHVLFLVPSQLAAMLSFGFEDAVFLGDYEAVWFPRVGLIEAAIDSVKAARFLLPESGAHQRRPRGSVTLPVPSGGRLQVRVGTWTLAFGAICGAFHPFRCETLKIFGAQAASEVEALAELRRVSDSILFELSNHGAVCSLIRLPRSVRTMKGSEIYVSIEEPVAAYDPIAMAFYWHGCESSHIPLLAFLSFYQVCEYFFPPKTKVLATERARFSALLSRTIDSERLRQFLERESSIRSTIAGRGPSRIVVDAGSTPEELLAQVASRVYDIRCRIVHTKADHQGFLVPSDWDLERFVDDLRLVRLIAIRVLRAQSVPFHAGGQGLSAPTRLAVEP